MDGPVDLDPRDAVERLAASAEQRLAQWESDLTTGEASWTPAMFEILDYVPAEVRPSRAALLSRVHADDRPRVRALLEARAPTTNPACCDCRIVLADGRTRYVSIEVFVAESDESAVHLYGLIHDETHLHHARIELQRTATRLGRVNRLARDVSYEVELQDILRAVDEALSDLVQPDRLSVGLLLDGDDTKQELIAFRGDTGAYRRGARVPVLDVHRPLFAGRPFVEVRYDDSGEPAVRDLSDHGYVVGYSVALRSGTVLIGVLHAGWKREVEATDELLATLGAVADQVAPSVAHALAVRRARDEEVRLRQRQKLEAVGRLAAGVAHDFNNLLTVVMTACSVLQERLPDDPDLAAIGTAADRAAVLTRQLMAFGGQQVLASEPLSLDQVVTSMRPLLDRTLGDAIQVRSSRTEEDTTIRADRSSIEQVITNLAVNARDAMPEGGVLELRTGRRTVDVAAARAANAAPGDYVTLEISDTGEGMDAESTGRVFDPFFSTKTRADGGAPGLGLATVYGIVMQSAGFIELESTPGAGTKFTIAFPHADPLSTPATAPTPVAHERTGRTVLLAEDQEQVRRLVARVLVRMGWEVLMAEDADEALRVAAEHRGAFELLVTDVQMPGKSGVELATLLLAERPELPVLFMSGHTMDDALQPLLARGHRFLQKPFLPSDLRDAIAALVQPARRAPE
ncbi:MAG: response regulator [Deltaproteobacteria bacterium]